MKKAPVSNVIPNQANNPSVLETDAKKYFALAKIYGILLKMTEEPSKEKREEKTSAPLQTNIPS